MKIVILLLLCLTGWQVYDIYIAKIKLIKMRAEFVSDFCPKIPASPEAFNKCWKEMK